MIDQLKDLKDTYEIVRSQIDRGKEPLEDLIKLRNFLQALLADPAQLNEKLDKEYKRYFYEDFSMGVLKRLTRERSKDEKYLEIISSVLESFMLLFLEELKQSRFNQQFFDSIKFLFEFDSILHNFNYQIPEDQLKSLRSSNQEWRKELKAGDMVDAILDEANARCSGWSQARISQVNGDVLHLEFIFDTKNADKFTDRWSVEVAPFESKTKELWEWKKTLISGQMIDAHDKSTWNKSTIIEIKEQTVAPERVVQLAYCGFRIYIETGTKNDEKGQYDGWSSRFDEWVSLYSPRIQPFNSKSQKGMQDDIDLDEDFDALLRPEEGFSRVYAVPRIRKCISSCFIHLINLFGEKGGFDIILNCFKKTVPEEESIDLNTMATLIQCISQPFIIYHKEFIQEYGPQFVALCKKRLNDAPEKSLRDVRREKIECIIKSIDNFQRRLVSKEVREKETEVLKLEVSLMCLKSGFLERRIQGIRDLNQIVKNNRMFSNKNFTSIFLIEWMRDNGVFNILFDPRQTHLQLVQRTTDILKLLLQDNMFTPQLMEQFWALSKTDYKFEIYKIINECSFYLQATHIDYFFEQIKQVPAEKLAMEEFQCLSELGKYTKEDDFKIKISNFFWNVICHSESYKEDLVNNCITKFCEMVKLWDIQKKHQFFIELTKNLHENRSSIPSIRLFKGLIKDQKERYSYSYNNSPQKVSPATALSEEQGSEPIKDPVVELTLTVSLEILIKEHGMIGSLLENLKTYCKTVNEKIHDVSTISNETRKKLFIVDPKYSHFDEIEERLQFLKYISLMSPTFHISKLELEIIYNLLVTNSKVPTDQEEFLTWCKSACEQSTPSNQILDLNEVGEFFTSKMQSGELDVKNLIVVGFDFLQSYFISVNEKEQKIVKIVKPVKVAKYTSYTYAPGYSYGPKPLNQSGYNNVSNNNSKSSDEEDSLPTFKLLTQPANLEQLEIVWSMALQCENPKVVPKAIDFLIQVYYSLDTDMQAYRSDIQEALIERCMHTLKTDHKESSIKRIITIIKHMIFEAEKKGTVIKPHNAMLKGEFIERITIKNKASPQHKNILMSIYSNTTVWELKKEVSRQLELAPKYLKLEKGLNRVIKDSENGKTLGELGFQTGDFVTAYKVTVEEEVVNAPITGADKKLTEKAKAIFNEWFDLYSNENGRMTKETCALFIKGCTGEYPGVNDDRIQGLFKTYDINNDGFIERQEFLIFYESSANQKVETVRENMRAHNIRADLKKLSEITEETTFTSEDMPRYTISKNQEYFDLLLSLLERQSPVPEESWNLIQMLATNQDLYKRVLQLKTAFDPTTKTMDWSKFFDSNSVYKLLYTLQIVEAVMEEGEGDNMERIIVVDAEEQKKKIPQAPPLVGAANALTVEQIQESVQEETSDQPAVKEQSEGPSQFKRLTSVVTNDEEDKQLRSSWTQQFLENKGFQYILKVFMEKQIEKNDDVSGFQAIFELKHIAFLLKLLRIFIMAAFSTSQANQEAYSAATLVRKTSSVQDEEQEITNNASSDGVEGSRFKDLQRIFSGPLGEEIIQLIDYKQLQQKILNIIAQILTKQNMIFEDKLIIENALSLFVGCVLHKPALLNDFYSFSTSTVASSNDFILQGVLFCQQEKVREEFKMSFNGLCRNLLSVDQVREIPLFYMLKLMSQNFSLISDYHCKQYFELFCDLIDQFFISKSLGSSDSVFNPESLLAQIIDKIKEYNKLSNEESLKQPEGDDEELAESASVSEQENIYIGLIQLTGKIIDNFDISFSEKIIETKNLIDEIFVQFLFASIFKQDGSNATETLRIKPKKTARKSGGKKLNFGKKSKDAAYKLLQSLIRKSPLLMNSFLEKSMSALMKLIKKHDGWNYSPPGASERQQKYVGLQNLGCICYMNSVLQQFFMTPAFRYNLLCVDDKQPEDLVEYKGFKIDDNVLHQLQKLVAHLELSERNVYNPFEFCFAFKDLDGNPTNTGIQQDAQEFLSQTFDRVENLLRGTSRKYLMQSVFGGQSCNQFVCKECHKVKNKIEDFYTLSLTVKDTKSIYESLRKMLEGEVINDYECDQCKKKVDIDKRQLISKTPNVLIIHLQRIIFNFDKFMNEKINTFFEFPYQLDLTPYSFYEVMKKENRLKKENTDEEHVEEVIDEDNQWPEHEDCFEYKLVGVNVHSGTANAGHYWSYINTRRGYSEPNSNDPNWSKTETDPWMEFNDSVVSDFNFEKLRSECFGGDGKQGSDDNFNLGGSSYGKSAYMLVYERKKKRDLKILLTKEEAEESKDASIQYDEKKEEYFKMIDYREGVIDIAPNNIYKQVFEDNQKFEFENDIYSSEFYDFVKGILNSVASLANDRRHDPTLMKSVKQGALSVGKKTILELLCKSFHNQSLKSLVDALCEILKTDDQLCIDFLEQCFAEDNCNYLFELMLDCTDQLSRLHACNLVKFVLNRLKEIEKDRLFDLELVEVTNEKGEKEQVEQFVAVSSRFMNMCVSLFNTRVAKSWSRFDNFLELIYSYSQGEQSSPDQIQQEGYEVDTTGLEFFFRIKFVEKACDFLLGKKSPLCQLNEKRIEMGGSFTQPNFSYVTKLVTSMITCKKLVDKYPLTDIEKKLFLHNDLLKVMLGSATSSKQFGQCLADMCTENQKMTKKVAKVFIKAINSSNFDNVKSYLTALKPFLKQNDSLKSIKLEWVFGFNQILSRKGYKEEKYKYGLELVDRINEDANTYISPIIYGAVEESLLGQLLKSKGKMDTLAINCLKEMISLMAKDDEIAKFVYQSAPSTYQFARYSDWIRPYLEAQKSEIERSNSYNYFKNKHDTIVKSLNLLQIFEQKCIGFKNEEMAALERIRSEGGLDDITEDWMVGSHPGVIPHFPPQLVIGKQVAEDKEFMVYDQDPLVRVILNEVTCEYNYSNPTGNFNLSLPQIELKMSNYQTMSYAEVCKVQFQEQQKLNKIAAEEKKREQMINEMAEAAEATDVSDQPSDDVPQLGDPQEAVQDIQEEIILEVQQPEVVVRNWFQNKKEGPVLLKVLVSNKEKNKVKVKITIQSEDSCPNVKLPQSQLHLSFIDADTKCLIHLQKIDPRKGWGSFKINVVSKDVTLIPNAPSLSTGQNITVAGISVGTSGASIACKCGIMNDIGQDYCCRCGDALLGDLGDASNQDHYFNQTDQRGSSNSMY